MQQSTYLVDSVEALERKISEVRKAQEAFSAYTQERVDQIFRAAALAANKARLTLAKDAVEETGMGVVEDKVIKNNYAAEYIYNAYKDTKTCGVIEEDNAAGIVKIAEPIGVVAAVIPTTNPTSTAIFASGMRCRLAARAAAWKMRSTCSWEKAANFCCAALTRASVASNSAMPSSTTGAGVFALSICVIFLSVFGMSGKPFSRTTRHSIRYFYIGSQVAI